MRAAVLPLLLVCLTTITALGAAQKAPRPGKFDGARAYNDIRELVAIGPRPPQSAGIQDARRYITGQLKAQGIAVAEQPFETQTPLGPTKMVNLVATIPGASPDRIVFAGHYDTKLFREFRFVGANDGGSSTAFLLELGRVLAHRKNPFTIELLFLDGEEALVDWQPLDAGRPGDHTYGSRYYVEAARKAGTLAHIKALILVDMIGDRNLNIRRETMSTRWLTDIIWASAKKLHQAGFTDDAMEVQDDHVPFLAAGVPAVDVIDLDYPPWHTAEDTLDKVSAGSLQSVGDVILDALPAIEQRLSQGAKPVRKSGKK